MSTISLRSNIASFRAQRQLSRATNALSQNFERLSSGLRINRASDDAAGLAVADGLRADARVYGQAILNVNESISLLNVADSAATELTNILSNLRELATKASNSTLSTAQRLALDTEGKALTDEFNRIVDATDYNNLSLFDEDRGTLSTQAGYSSASAISFDVGSDLARTIGDGTFQTNASFTVSGVAATTINAEDINGDGRVDLLIAGGNDAAVKVKLGNGDGTFATDVSYDTVTNASDQAVADFNGDNILDVVVSGGSRISIVTGAGDGTFSTAVTYTTGANPTSLAAGDLDGDGDVDIVSGSFSGGVLYANVHLNNGDGTFAAFVSYTAVGTGGSSPDLAIEDFDNDGNLDVVLADFGNDKYFLLTGTGSGTLNAATSFDADTNLGSVETGDINLDGNIDLISSSATTGDVTIRLGNGDGSFQSITTVTPANGPRNTALGDYNGDGFLDIFTPSSGLTDVVEVFQGDGTGSFSSIGTFGINSFGGVYITTGDFNGDGALDFATTSNSQRGDVVLANSTTTTTIQRLNLATQSTAQEAVTTIDAALNRLTLERGAIGAGLSRHEVASSLLFTQRDNFLEAESNIRDVDVAAESALLVSNQIVQEAAAAVLSQANLQSNLAIQLLGDL